MSPHLMPVCRRPLSRWSGCFRTDKGARDAALSGLDCEKEYDHSARETDNQWSPYGGRRLSGSRGPDQVYMISGQRAFAMSWPGRPATAGSKGDTVSIRHLEGSSLTLVMRICRNSPNGW